MQLFYISKFEMLIFTMIDFYHFKLYKFIEIVYYFIGIISNWGKD